MLFSYHSSCIYFAAINPMLHHAHAILPVLFLKLISWAKISLESYISAKLRPTLGYFLVLLGLIRSLPNGLNLTAYICDPVTGGVTEGDRQRQHG